ncbi:hypothetical protein [Pseudoalteromonas sp. S16_S37]|uniref:hypothetical protein n=1 Tax=Pseudoalteromonas sp. S16_S37 TaxID=2720228 RepID=UPI001EED6372|nr:hypothetical protein [Pseudoalteromonas sp. S16_S37]
MNYYKAFDDFWLSNSSEYIDWKFVEKSAVGTSSQGTAFDNIALLKRKALVGGSFNLIPILLIH